MSYHGSPPTRQRLLLDKRRKQTRRQVMRLAVLAVLLLLLLGLVSLAALVIRNMTARRLAAPPPSTVTEASKPRPRARLALTRNFRPAPWFIALDSNRIYVAQDKARKSVDGAGFPLDSLEAYSLDNRKLVWESSLGNQYSNIALAGSMLITFSEHLGEYTGFEINAYDSATGENVWTIKSDQGENAQIACDSSVVTVGYRVLPNSEKDSGYRFRGYHAKTGKEAWRQSPKMFRLRAPELDSSPASASLQLEAYEGLVVYQVSNVAGVLNSAINPKSTTAPVLSEFSCSEGYVLDVQVDTNARTAYALCSGGKPGLSMIEMMPLGKESPTSICKIDSLESRPLLLADRGYLLAAYQIEGLEGSRTTKIIGFRNSDLMNKKKKDKQPSFNYKFDTGTPADLAALPDRQGEFLLALNESLDKSGRPSGPSSLRRISLGEAEPKVWEAARQKQSVMLLAPFKLDCFVLCRGGELKLFSGLNNNLSSLRRHSFPELGAAYSPNRASLAITSYTREFMEGRSGLPYQISVWH